MALFKIISEGGSEIQLDTSEMSGLEIEIGGETFDISITKK